MRADQTLYNYTNNHVLPLMKETNQGQWNIITMGIVYLLSLSHHFQAKYILLSTINAYLNTCTKARELYKKRERAADVTTTDSELTDQLLLLCCQKGKKLLIKMSASPSCVYCLRALLILFLRLKSWVHLKSFIPNLCHYLLLLMQTKRKQLLHAILHYNFLFPTMVLEMMLHLMLKSYTNSGSLSLSLFDSNFQERL